MEESSIEKQAPSASESAELPPEEGLRGWLCVLGTFLCMFCSFGFLNSMGVFQKTYEETILREYSASSISWIFAVQLALLLALGPLYGRIFDTYGPGPVLYTCSLLCVFSLCMTSLSHEYYQIFLSQGLAFGIGVGGLFSSGILCVGQWFVRRRGLATGIASTGSSVGGIIFPIFMDRVMQQVGFAGAVRYVALLMGILLVVACILTRPRLPRKKWNRDAKWFDATVFKQKEFSLFATGVYLTMWGMWAPFNYISTMAVQGGFSPTLALYLISMINATAVPGRIIPPFLGDVIGHFNIFTISTFGSGVAILALWLPFNYHPSHAGLIVFALVYGSVSGAVVSLFMPCVAKLGKLETLGQRFGTFQIAISVSCLTGLPIEGAILNRQHGDNYSGLQIFAGLSLLLGSCFLAASTFLLARERGTWKV
ncbi:uncharacterized protein N7459_004760 [Penicillium hispanicum]|uniref:uncharacterized protein n=1 Tax=Penicillium hispanicum TaxID=1080232 RepID=UPI002540C281|nr:uncharacterized protein N7459_004760 [Penicillium hispanicum]KAJ5584960.1 hypothetical protein N7459_004760 [Penicillium hispanicum]